MDAKQRKQLHEKIASLSSTEHEEILKIITVHGVAHSRNKNGVFFNLTGAEAPVLEALEKFVGYCVVNQKELDDYDKKLNECKLSNNFYGMLPQRHNLAAMGKRTTEQPMTPKPSWSAVKTDERTMELFARFVERMTQDRDVKKKSNLKYANAKKRFSKRVMIDRKFEEGGDILVMEPYLLT